MKKIFLDTEFTGLHQKTKLISLAFVAESGEAFYAEFSDFDIKGADNITQQFFKNEVIPQLGNLPYQVNEINRYYVSGNTLEIKLAITKWFNQFQQTKNSLQIWADYYAWDWVLFCELFGGAFCIPQNIHYMTMDLATFLFSRNVKRRY
ncbi:MAG: 3'-5' exoribonuclease [Sphingobacteriales bacterium]|nr:3'-5' exoribonuclease [Sphingobacteriales bacterium]